MSDWYRQQGNYAVQGHGIVQDHGHGHDRAGEQREEIQVTQKRTARWNLIEYEVEFSRAPAEEFRLPLEHGDFKCYHILELTLNTPSTGQFRISTSDNTAGPGELTQQWFSIPGLARGTDGKVPQQKLGKHKGKLQLNVLCVHRASPGDSDRFALLDRVLPDDLNAVLSGGTTASWFPSSSFSQQSAVARERERAERAVAAAEQHYREAAENLQQLEHANKEVQDLRKAKEQLKATLAKRDDKIAALKKERDEATKASTKFRNELRGNSAQSLENTNGLTDVIKQHKSFEKDLVDFLGTSELTAGPVEDVVAFMKLWIDTVNKLIQEKVDSMMQNVNKAAGGQQKENSQNLDYLIRRSIVQLLQNTTHIKNQLSEPEKNVLLELKQQIPAIHGGKSEEEAEEDFQANVQEITKDLIQVSKHLVRLMEWLYIQSLMQGSMTYVQLDFDTLGKLADYHPDFFVNASPKKRKIEKNEKVHVVFPSLVRKKKAGVGESDTVEEFLTNPVILASDPMKQSKHKNPAAPSTESRSEKKTKLPNETSPENSKAGKSKAGKSKADHSKADKSKPDNSKADNSKADNSKADNSKADNSKADNSKANKSKPDNSKADKSKPDNSKADKSKADKLKTMNNQNSTVSENDNPAQKGDVDSPTGSDSGTGTATEPRYDAGYGGTDDENGRALLGEHNGNQTKVPKASVSESSTSLTTKQKGEDITVHESIPPSQEMSGTDDGCGSEVKAVVGTDRKEAMDQDTEQDNDEESSKKGFLNYLGFGRGSQTKPKE